LAIVLQQKKGTDTGVSRAFCYTRDGYDVEGKRKEVAKKDIAIKK
jgi:hypothetical protein